MSVEWLDIVDEHDRVTGRDTRENIHKSGLYHRSTHVLLFNSRGELFVQLRSLAKDENAGLWDTSAAGHVDSGESYISCAVRELHEELGISLPLSALEHIASFAPQQRNGYEFSQVFKACSDQTLVLQTEEIDDGRWVTPAELDAWIDQNAHDFTDVFRDIWKSTGPNQT